MAMGVETPIGPRIRGLLAALALTVAPGAAPALADCPTPGCQLWLSTYNGPANGPDRANSTVISPDGTRLFVTGRSPGSGNDYASAAYDAASGAQLWVARYDGAGGDDAATGIGVSPDGARVFVTGTSAGSGNLDIATVAYDAATGNQLWVARYNGPGNGDDNGTGLVVSPGGSRVYVTGYVTRELLESGLPNYDYGTIAYDAVTGDPLWVAAYNGPGNFWDVAYAITVAPISSSVDRVVVTGRSNGLAPNPNGSDNRDADFATVAYDGATGQQAWLARYNGTGNDRDLAYAVRAADPACSPCPPGAGPMIFVTGESIGSNGEDDYATLAYRAVDGSPLWTARYDVGQLNIPFSIAVDPFGQRLCITGFSVNPTALTNYDRSMATIAYDVATGAQVWAARDSAPDGEVGIATAVSPDGSQFYVAGAEGAAEFFVNGAQLGDNALLALAYDAGTGTRLWRNQYLGSVLNVDGEAVTVSPDGQTVFVAGGGDDTGADYATIAYFTGLPVTAVRETAPPGGARLLRCSPNPARRSAIVRFSMPAAGPVTLAVFDLRGRRVETLLDHELRPAGDQQVSFRAHRFEHGLYFLRLEAGGRVVTKKLVVLE